MTNTVIQIKKSSTPTAIPSSLADGELALNFADGKLFYKNTTGYIVQVSSSSVNSFGSINANGTFVVADTPTTVVSLIAGSGINIVGDAIADTITFSASGGGGGGILNTSPSFFEGTSNNSQYLSGNSVTNLNSYADTQAIMYAIALG
jgi:hypothetical protein